MDLKFGTLVLLSVAAHVGVAVSGARWTSPDHDVRRGPMSVTVRQMSPAPEERPPIVIEESMVHIDPSTTGRTPARSRDPAPIKVADPVPESTEVVVALIEPLPVKAPPLVRSDTNALASAEMIAGDVSQDAVQPRPSRTVEPSRGTSSDAQPIAQGVVLLTPPTALPTNMPPAYPRRARRRGLEGDVVLVVHVDAGGAVTYIKIERSSGHTALDAAAVYAAQRWRFKPATRNGQPVRDVLMQPVRFVLK